MNIFTAVKYCSILHGHVFVMIKIVIRIVMLRHFINVKAFYLAGKAILKSTNNACFMKIYMFMLFILQLTSNTHLTLQFLCFTRLSTDYWENYKILEIMVVCTMCLLCFLSDKQT